jgi:signal transduction histidine kinase
MDPMRRSHRVRASGIFAATKPRTASPPLAPDAAGILAVGPAIALGIIGGSSLFVSTLLTPSLIVFSLAAAAALGALAVALMTIVRLKRRLVRSEREWQAHEAAIRAESERALAARDELLAIVGHDLRNPLGAIALRAARLRRSSVDSLKAEGEAIERLVVSAERLLQTMLDAGQIDAAGLLLDLDQCSLDDVLREVVDIFGHLAEARSVRIRCATGASAITLWADRERLIQIFSNLLSNAIKFAPSGSEVVLKVDPEGGQLHFRVTDAGPGIPAADIGSIFDRFWKGRSSSHKGTGLGLYIARKLVEAHGGRIWAESTPDHGTAVHFTLPAHDVIPPVRPATEMAPAPPPPPLELRARS